MAIVIDDNTLEGISLTENDLKKEIAVALYEKKIFTFTQSLRFSGIERLAFENLLAERKIPIYSYDNYIEDLQTVNEFP